MGTTTIEENTPVSAPAGLGTEALLRVYERDLTLVSGKGTRVVDADGKTYLDFAAGIAVSALGHCDPKVVAAIKKQAATLMHVSNGFHSEPGTRLAERLVALTFPSRVFFTNSGTESAEGALKFARAAGKDAGRFELIGFERGFAGRTLGALSLTWNPKYRVPFEPLVPGTRFIPWNDLRAAEGAIGPKTAAVIIEPVQGEGGVHPAPPEFLRGLRELTKERGALLICDEVQCGLGRTGRLFAYQHAGITPDILTMAKALGGGLPMGAVLLREDLAPALKVGEHGSTFGGNPVAAAAAFVVLERLTSPGFLEGVQKRGATLLRGLKKLQRKYPRIVGDVRGLGLMLGAQIKGVEVKTVLRALRDRGLLCNRAGEDVLRIVPPLIVKPSEVRTALETLDATLASFQ